MKHLLLVTLFLSCSAGLFANGKIWLDKKGRWTTDSVTAVSYACVSKIKEGTLVEIFSKDGVKKKIESYSIYVENVKKRIKDGISKELYADGKDKSITNYVNNQKDGEQMFFYPQGGKHFVYMWKNGKNISMMQYYPNGTLRREENYNQKIRGKVTGKLFDEQGHKMKFEPYKVMPEFPDGNLKFLHLLKTHIVYPKEIADSKISGKVVVGFTIRKDGTLDKIKILRSLHPLLDDATLDGFRYMAEKYKWISGRLDGEVVDMEMVLPVTYKSSK